MLLRLAVATEDFSQPLRRSIALASQLEVPGVRLNARSELDALNCNESALRQILLYAKERQMHIAGLSCPTKHSLYDDEYLEERLDLIRKSMALVRKLNTKELLIRCGQIPDPDTDVAPKESGTSSIEDQPNPFSFATAGAAASPSSGKQFNLLCEILNDLAQHGNHVGCVLNLQLSGFDVRLIKRLLNEIKTGPISIVLDPATAVMTGTNPESTYRDLYEQIGYVRARDAVKDIDGAGTEVGVGAGVVDWIQLIPTLVEADYAGWVCVERTGGDNRFDDVDRGVSRLKSLIPQTGD